MRGETPIATSAISASRVSVALPLTVRRTPLFVVSALSTFVPVRSLMPCLASDFSRVWLTSVSSTGRIFGIISTTVTFEPKALKKYANSMPMAPAPIMMISFGCFSKTIA